MRLSTLLNKQEQIIREIAQLEDSLAEIRAQILDAAQNPPRRTRKRATIAEVRDEVAKVVKVLKASAYPLPRAEVAARLGVAPNVASHRLLKAMELKFVEKVPGARYRVTSLASAA